MIEDNLFLRTLTTIEKKRLRRLEGKINCIPWGLPRFENQVPGIEKGKYYLFTANSKVKSDKYNIKKYKICIKKLGFVIIISYICINIKIKL